MSGSRGTPPESPRAPGWYPDPFSADGRGERYWDGKRWGSSERPLGRHSSASSNAPTKLPTGNARRGRRVRRTVRGTGGRFRDRIRRSGKPILAVAIFLGIGFGIVQFREWRNSSHSDRPVTSPTTRTPNLPPPGHEEAAQPLGKPAAVADGDGSFDVLMHQPDSSTTPVAWDPCRPIHYVVDATGAPPDGLALLRSAIARVSVATGLRFVYDGSTNELPDKQRPPYQPERYPGRWAPVLVAWSDEQAYPQLAGYVAGLGEPYSVQTESGHLVYLTGQVVFDKKDLSPARLRDRATVRAIMLHELGHLVGLDHTSDPHEIMYSEAQFNVRDYGPGDRRGLSAVGAQACFPNV